VGGCGELWGAVGVLGGAVGVLVWPTNDDDDDDVNDKQGQHTDEMLASFVRKLGQLSLALLRESTEKQVCGGVNKVLVFWWDARTFGGRRTEQTWAMDRRAAVDGGTHQRRVRRT